MKKWTDDAQAYRDRYLRRAQVLLEGGGADAREVVDDLARHIDEQVNASPEVVITIDVLKGILTTMGTPEEVALSWKQMGSEVKPDPWVETSPREPIRSNDRSSAWIFLGCLAIAAVFILVPAVLALLFISFFWVSTVSSPEVFQVPDSAHIGAETTSTDLHDAASGGDLEQVHLLLMHGALVNARDADGMTALHHAAKNGHVKTTEFLIGRGADIAIRDNGGKTALDHAIAEGHEETAAVIRGQPQKNVDQ